MRTGLGYTRDAVTEASAASSQKALLTDVHQGILDYICYKMTAGGFCDYSRCLNGLCGEREVEGQKNKRKVDLEQD